MRRRFLLGSVGVTGLASLGAFAYQAAPVFWKQFAKEMGRPIGSPALHPDPRKWPDTGLHATWLGHSTVLLKVDGTTILTDPVFSDRIGLNFGPVTLGLKRLVATAAPLTRLPQIDLILLSHAHMDHFDIPTLRLLESHRTSVLTAAKTSDLLRPRLYREVRELHWGERARMGAVDIRALEVRHWGARMRTDTYRGYNGYLLEIGRYRILFGGDTAITPAFQAVRSARPVDLAIMPIGAYDPWIRVHCNPEQAWTMANHAGSEFILPVHHQTFQLSREGRLEPLERVLAAAGSAPERVCVQEIGQEFHLN